MTAAEDRERALTALADLWARGCPIPTPDARDRLVEVGIRRWQSFGRRSRAQWPSYEDQVQDLTRGLRDAFEPDRSLVGRLIRDYRCVAEAIGAVLTHRPPPASH